jgi:hypothetical protein
MAIRAIAIDLRYNASQQIAGVPGDYPMESTE